MNLTREQAKGNLTALIAKFKSELESGKTQTYNEESTKTAFIQPLLKDVLGWDVNDHDEVSPEEKVSRDRVDYGLKLNSKTVMFVEAKPVRTDLNNHIEQAVKYGYNRKDVSFIMLTDFEGIMLFDTSIKPNFKNLKKAMKLDISWKDYISRFDELWILSKESVLAGKLDELIKIKPKDRTTIDKAILEDLEGWREKLAKDIYKNNNALFNSGDPDKDGTYLKEITQKILDRIIFMRFCEDRNLSNRPTLKSIYEERNEAVGTKAMIFLDEEFKHFNITFDSDLFGLRDWDGKIAVDIKPLKEIILATYDPYLFDVIPLEVLGNIYEQYLGYTIKLTEHQAKYELKPEVRKAGGVYYTPKYIVDYIVKNTVGKVLEESSPAKIKKLSILDPACGSGSFLIRAYEEMLNYYRGLKVKGDKILDGQADFGIRGDGKERELTIWEKAEILKRHIYGVDIDEQAVEVTKLSLMLKMLEGEQGLIAGRNVLPMLDKNIKCGNSLISGDSQELFKYFGKDYWKVKPFNWKEEFKQIMVDEGGFDVVVGNPPYGATLTLEIKKYLKEKYSFVADYETSQYFVGLSSSLLKRKGLISFIVPNTMFLNLLASNYRAFLNTKFGYERIANLSNIDVFEGATVRTAIPFFKKGNENKSSIVLDNYKYINDKEIILTEESISYPIEKDWSRIFSNQPKSSVLPKITSRSVELNEILVVSQGLIPYDKYRGHDENTIKNRIWNSDHKKDDTYKKELRGGDVKRYTLVWNGKQWISYGPWLAAPRKKEYFTKPRLLFREISDPKTGLLHVAFSDEEYYNNPGIINCIARDSEYSMYYLLGVVNSKLIAYYHFNNSPKAKKGAFPKILVNDVRKLPVKVINFEDKNEKKKHDKISNLALLMIDLNKKISSINGNEKDQLQRQIDQTDKEIDELVYTLYGITEEEKNVIKNVTSIEKNK